MKVSLILSSLLLVSTSTQASEWLAADKAMHSVGSYGITHATQAICNRATEGNHKTGCLITGIALASAVGIAKEVHDQVKRTNTTKQSLQDGVADAVGISAAVLMIQIDF